jgi:hypothetical protein
MNICSLYRDIFPLCLRLVYWEVIKGGESCECLIEVNSVRMIHWYLFGKCTSKEAHSKPHWGWTARKRPAVRRVSIFSQHVISVVWSGDLGDTCWSKKIPLHHFYQLLPVTRTLHRFLVHADSWFPESTDKNVVMENWNFLWSSGFSWWSGHNGEIIFFIWSR